MLFNSYIFIFVFLPLAVAGYHLLGKGRQTRAASAWLVAVSLWFYGWWNPVYLGLIIGSLLFNYTVGILLTGNREARSLPRSPLLFAGVAVNIGLLGYFKYANFFVESLAVVLGMDVSLAEITLPLAMSFFTFQQIAYLVDAYHSSAREYSFLDYTVFVTFFPQLIAGPIVHHREMMPQFERDETKRVTAENLSIGISIFVLGLFKKVILADGLSGFAIPVFAAAANGETIGFFDAWCGVLAYTFQLYFDFSGYSDMAVGLARMFGIRLPQNFFSPYKATSAIEFWRRWHITLSRFLRDYLYIPLGGNRKGTARRYLNLFVTMLLGGLWHGAGWTFVLWGALHGAYLVVNYGWLRLRAHLSWTEPGPFGRAVGWLITFFAVTAGWNLFRAESVDAAALVYRGMFGLGGFAMNQSLAEPFGLLGGGEAPFQETILHHGPAAGAILVSFLIVLLLPNVQQWMEGHHPVLEETGGRETPLIRLTWSPNGWWWCFTVTMFVICVVNGSRVSEFLYFQF